MTPEQLEAIEGIGPKTVEKISLAVNNYFASLESGTPVEGEATEEAAQGEPAAEASAAGGEVAGEAATGEELASGQIPAEEVAGEPQAAAANETDEQGEQPAPEAESTSETRE
jgi:N utilization substance protein A